MELAFGFVKHMSKIYVGSCVIGVLIAVSVYSRLGITTDNQFRLYYIYYPLIATFLTFGLTYLILRCFVSMDLWSRFKRIPNSFEEWKKSPLKFKFWKLIGVAASVFGALAIGFLMGGFFSYMLNFMR